MRNAENGPAFRRSTGASVSSSVAAHPNLVSRCEPWLTLGPLQAGYSPGNPQPHMSDSQALAQEGRLSESLSP